ncbi:MAG: CDP-alcohol phosphatidyltransferase family protein [Flaviflexus sp.]|uniref:phosphatidylinositol phosphate synthase n=1 Tax=Flaviflexus sp. TaxID=1969482 RepID=UPI00352CB828
MLSRSGRPLFQVLFGPVARLFVRMGISADAVTITGTILSCAIALWLIPTDHLTVAAWAIFAVVIFDNLDGQIARLTGTSSKWGAFLDSTMDRFADGAIFLAVAIWSILHADESLANWTALGAVVALLMGAIVPYAKARAEAVGYTANIGIAERADRLTVILVGVFFVGLEWGDWWLTVATWVLAVLGFFTVIQRMATMYKQAKAEDVAERISKSAQGNEFAHRTEYAHGADPVSGPGSASGPLQGGPDAGLSANGEGHAPEGERDPQNQGGIS